ncbi:hypothetical protein AMTRI_Chr11g100470 [Amborella trichopoda]
MEVFKNQPPNAIDGRWSIVSVGSACYVYSLPTLYSQGMDHLMCFDMDREKWEIIHTPIWLVSSCYYEIQERDGWLCLIQLTLDEIALAQIWVLLQEKKWVQLMKTDLGQLGFHKLEELGVVFGEFHIYPKFLFGDTLLWNILAIDEFFDHSDVGSGRKVGWWKVTSNIKSGELGKMVRELRKMVQDAQTRFFMYQPTLFTCKMEKNGKIHLG